MGASEASYDGHDSSVSGIEPLTTLTHPLIPSLEREGRDESY